MRRALILLLLLWGMAIIEPLGRSAPASQALLTFGFLILAAYTVGEIARAVRLPMLFGYMLAGIVFGPSLLNIVTRAAIAQVSSLNQLAISLIALLAGAELEWKAVRGESIGYLKILTAEVGLTYVGAFVTIVVLSPHIPVVANADKTTVTVFAMLLAAVVVAHSPAATLGILTETKASGPAAKTALGVVLTSDIFIFLLFTLVATGVQLLMPSSGAGSPGLGLVLWEVVGAVIVGTIIGGVVAFYLRFSQRDLLLLGLIIALLGGEIARLSHVEILLTLLTTGFVACNVMPSENTIHFRHGVERAATPFFVVFFALAGASIPLAEVRSVLIIVVPIVVVRYITIWTGTRWGTRWADMTGPPAKHLWMSLIAQAGVAIGFASVAAEIYPELGPTFRTLAFAVIAMNELFGPILFRRALAKAGEIEP